MTLDLVPAHIYYYDVTLLFKLRHAVPDRLRPANVLCRASPEAMRADWAKKLIELAGSPTPQPKAAFTLVGKCDWVPGPDDPKKYTGLKQFRP